MKIQYDNTVYIDSNDHQIIIDLSEQLINIFTTWFAEYDKQLNGFRMGSVLIMVIFYAIEYFYDENSVDIFNKLKESAIQKINIEKGELTCH